MKKCKTGFGPAWREVTLNQPTSLFRSILWPVCVAAFALWATFPQSASAQLTKRPGVSYTNAFTPQKLFSSALAACADPSQAFSSDFLSDLTYGSTTHCGDYDVVVTGTAFTGPPYMSAQGMCTIDVWAKRAVSAPPRNCAGETPGEVYTVPPTTANFPISTWNVCPVGWPLDAGSLLCKRSVAPVSTDTPRCGNPIMAGSGCKSEHVALGEVPAGPVRLSLLARYSSVFPYGGGKSIGQPAWSLDPVDRRIESDQPGNSVWLVESGGDGAIFTSVVGGGYQSQSLQKKLEQIGTDWRLWDYEGRFVEMFNSTGALVSRRYFEGGGFDVGYAVAAGTMRPTTLTTVTGHVVTLAWNTTSVTSLTLPGGSTVSFTYIDVPTGSIPRGLGRITFQDGKYREFQYASSKINGIALAGSNPSSLILLYPTSSGGGGSSFVPSPQDTVGDRATDDLVAIIDEREVNFAQFEYDGNGRGAATQHSGGVQRFTFLHSTTNPIWVTSNVTGPLGGSSQYVLEPVNGLLRVTQVRGSATPIGPGASANLAYDSMGRVVSRLDYAAWTATCWSYDAATHREAVRQEGPYTLSCYNFVSNGIPPGTTARQIHSEWHPTWRLLKRQALPKRRVTYFYNGDVEGGAAINCAPAAAQVAGSPMPVLCKVREEVTNDENGSAGFTSTLVGTPRIVNYTYNARGQVLTVDGPRTDATDVAAYQYYESSTASYSVGDLQSVTRGGQTWTVSSYNAHGQPLTVVDPNGLSNAIGYDARGRMTSSSETAGGQIRTTNFSYTEVGQLRRVTQPDGGYIEYTYDNAQRLTAVADNLGNSVTYTLDNAGNRIGEQSKDPGNALRKQITRAYDILSRLQTVTGAAQ